MACVVNRAVVAKRLVNGNVLMEFLVKTLIAHQRMKQRKKIAIHKRAVSQNFNIHFNMSLDRVARMIKRVSYK